jgi:hypothetical protein
MVCAKDFLAGFTAEYDAARRGHTDAAWAAIWGDETAWTRLMIKENDAVCDRSRPGSD